MDVSDDHPLGQTKAPFVASGEGPSLGTAESLLLAGGLDEVAPCNQPHIIARTPDSLELMPSKANAFNDEHNEKWLKILDDTWMNQEKLVRMFEFLSGDFDRFADLMMLHWKVDRLWQNPGFLNVQRMDQGHAQTFVYQSFKAAFEAEPASFSEQQEANFKTDLYKNLLDCPNDRESRIMKAVYLITGYLYQHKVVPANWLGVVETPFWKNTLRSELRQLDPMMKLTDGLQQNQSMLKLLSQRYQRAIKFNRQIEKDVEKLGFKVPPPGSPDFIAPALKANFYPFPSDCHSMLYLIQGRKMQEMSAQALLEQLDAWHHRIEDVLESLLVIPRKLYNQTCEYLAAEAENPTPASLEDLGK